LVAFLPSVVSKIVEALAAHSCHAGALRDRVDEDVLAAGEVDVGELGLGAKRRGARRADLALEAAVEDGRAQVGRRSALMLITRSKRTGVLHAGQLSS
jgi:hypothetical protein